MIISLCFGRSYDVPITLLFGDYNVLSGCEKVWHVNIATGSTPVLYALGMSSDFPTVFRTTVLVLLASSAAFYYKCIALMSDTTRAVVVSFKPPL
jgi:hypothetical protein